MEMVVVAYSKRVEEGCKQEAPLHNTGGKPGIMD